MNMFKKITLARKDMEVRKSDEEMTITKLIVLKHKGVEFDMYNKVMKKINKKK